MNDGKKGFILFSNVISPLALADWQIDVNFQMDRAGRQLSAQSSTSLVIGEQTILFDNDTLSGVLVGKAELLDVAADKVKISLLVQERCVDGVWRTIMASIINASLYTPACINVTDNVRDESASLNVMITSF